jgi:hypothetical protein
MVLHPIVPQYGHVQELAHHQDLHAPLPQLVTESVVALLAVGVGVAHYTPRFRFWRSLDDPQGDP